MTSRESTTTSGPHVSELAVRPHFPGLEGMRIVAAFLVVLTHATYLGYPPGTSNWIARLGRFGDAGVAIFFVLSGFLLYRPFVVAHVAGRSPMPALAFWWRRILRIFPCYWVALTVLWGLHTFQPFGFNIGFDLGEGWWRYYLLIQIYQPQYGQGGIAQSWSVATEVAFYLLLPFWVLFIRRISRSSRRPFAFEFVGIGALFVFGYLSRWWFSHFTALAVPPMPLLPDGVTWRAVSFAWLPNQIDMFAIGMAVAAVHVWASRNGIYERISGWTRLPTLWWVGAAGIYLTIVYGLGDNPSDYKSAYWQVRSVLYGLLGFTMLVPLVFGDQTKGLIRRFVNWKPIWWAGTVSYGLYLWHLNLMERMVTMPTQGATPGTFGPPKWHGLFGWSLWDASVLGLLIGGTIAGLAVAGVSWYLIERPLLRFKDAVGGRRAIRPDDRPDSP